MSKRLLIVDDAKLHRTILCRVAEKAGFVAEQAGTVDEAAMLMRERAFDCVTLDLSLGDRAGVEILYLLSEIKCRAPIIIISGSEHAVRDETLKIGKSLDLNLSAPVPKPVDLALLRETLVRIRTQVDLHKFVDAMAC